MHLIDFALLWTLRLLSWSTYPALLGCCSPLRSESVRWEVKVFSRQFRFLFHGFFPGGWLDGEGIVESDLSEWDFVAVFVDRLVALTKSATENHQACTNQKKEENLRTEIARHDSV